MKLRKETFEEDAVSNVQVFGWHKEFKNGPERIELRSGRPIECYLIKTLRARMSIAQDQRTVVRMFSED